MIHKLESAGLGYRVNADETEDRLGMEKHFTFPFSKKQSNFSSMRFLSVMKEIALLS